MILVLIAGIACFALTGLQVMRGRMLAERDRRFALEAARSSAMGTTAEVGAALLREALAGVEGISAVFTANDAMAFGVLGAAAKLGVRVPEDLAVIGCGNLHYDDALSVPLSSINQHSRRIGQEAARIALGILNSKLPLKVENVVLQPELIVRRSTQRRANSTARTKSNGRKLARQPRT